MAVQEREKLDSYDIVLENRDFSESVKKMESFLMGETVVIDQFDKERFIKEANELIYKFGFLHDSCI